jgi:hypothetical protein
MKNAWLLLALKLTKTCFVSLEIITRARVGYVSRLNLFQLLMLIFQGDLGSPLVEYVGPRIFAVGVSSFISSNGCESSDPSGYTRTRPYFEWILNTTRGN